MSVSDRCIRYWEAGERKPQPLHRAKVEQAIESLEHAQNHAQSDAQILNSQETNVQNMHIPEGEPTQTEADLIYAEEESAYNIDIYRFRKLY